MAKKKKDAIEIHEKARKKEERRRIRKNAKVSDLVRYAMPGKLDLHKLKGGFATFLTYVGGTDEAREMMGPAEFLTSKVRTLTEAVAELEKKIGEADDERERLVGQIQEKKRVIKKADKRAPKYQKMVLELREVSDICGQKLLDLGYDENDPFSITEENREKIMPLLKEKATIDHRLNRAETVYETYAARYEASAQSRSILISLRASLEQNYRAARKQWMQLSEKVKCLEEEQKAARVTLSLEESIVGSAAAHGEAVESEEQIMVLISGVTRELSGFLEYVKRTRISDEVLAHSHRSAAAAREAIDDHANRALQVPALQAAYGVLGLSEMATSAEVQEAYREKALTAHPDRGGNPEEFRKIKDAAALLDPPLDKIAEYDGLLESGEDTEQDTEQDSEHDQAYGAQ